MNSGTIEYFVMHRALHNNSKGWLWEDFGWDNKMCVVVYEKKYSKFLTKAMWRETSDKYLNAMYLRYDGSCRPVFDRIHLSQVLSRE